MPTRKTCFVVLILTATAFLQVSMHPATALAFQFEDRPNFPPTLKAAIRQESKLTRQSRAPESSEKVVMDTERKKSRVPARAISWTKDDPYAVAPSYNPLRQRKSALPTSLSDRGEVTDKSTLQLIEPAQSTTSDFNSSPSINAGQVNSKLSTQNRPDRGRYRANFGTVMTFPAGDDPVDYQFGDTSPFVRPPNRIAEEMKSIMQQPIQVPITQPPTIERLDKIADTAITSNFGDVPAKTLSSGVAHAYVNGMNVSTLPASIQKSKTATELLTSVVGPEALVEKSPDEFEIVVTNSSRNAATDVIVQVSIPDDLTVTKLDRDAWLDQEKRTISWKIAQIEVGQQEVIRYSAMGESSGRYDQKVVIGMANMVKGQTEFQTVVISRQEYEAHYAKDSE